MIDKKEHEIMSILQEESAEVIQAVSKIFRFGYDSKHPDVTFDNREHLAEELGDLLAMITLCQDFGIVNNEAVWIAKDKKLEKLRQWSNIYN